MLNLIDVPSQGSFHEQDLSYVENVKNKYLSLSEIDQNKRSRDLAQSLNITEAQWVASSLGSVKSIYLQGDGREVFKAIGAMGEVMALTRNQSCVHERHGQYLDIHADGPVGLVLGPDIHLRVFFNHWAHVWAVQDRDRLSLQFFDQSGMAVHKVFCTEETDVSAYLALVQRFAIAPVWPSAQAKPKAIRQMQTHDKTALRQAWLALKDTHDFFNMLKKFDVERLGAIHDVGPDLAQQVGVESIGSMLKVAAQTEIPIMCFVSNVGMIQIHSGHIKKIVQTEAWLNVLDPRFNLHLNLNHIQSVWVVNKPTIDGWVTSVEVFDHDGEMIVQFFGARKPGVPEQAKWRELLVSLCPKRLAA
jgi:putative hemin transport protein